MGRNRLLSEPATGGTDQADNDRAEQRQRAMFGHLRGTGAVALDSQPRKVDTTPALVIRASASGVVVGPHGELVRSGRENRYGKYMAVEAVRVARNAANGTPSIAR